MGRTCSMHGRDHICIITERVIRIDLKEMGGKEADWSHMVQWQGVGSTQDG